jgi:tetratricopeptide (TPR) repeat protein
MGGVQEPGGDGGGAPVSAVRAQLGRVLASPGFARAPRLRRFLTYVVDEALAGRFERLKEYSLGLDVFDRGQAFDPKADPIVRVDARRLRKALADYYAGAGAQDPVEIVIAAGGYLPAFRLRARPRAAGSPRAGASDAQAYELYLRGRKQLNATGPEKMARAIDLLRAAVELDPGFAEAHAAIAEAHFVSAIFGLAAPREALAAAALAAQAALAANPGLAAGHAQLGRARAALDHDFAAAEAAFDRAMALDPASPAVRQARAMWLLAPLGRLDEAAAETEALLDDRPYSRRLRFDHARLLTFRRDYPGAIRHLELILEFEPDFPGAAWALAMAYEHAGRAAEARALHERQVGQFAQAHPLVIRWLEAAGALWDADPVRARELIAAMDASARPTPVAASVMTDAWLRLGDADHALTWLERAADQRLLRVLHLAVDPDYDLVRGDRRYTALLLRLGLARA